MEFFPVDPAVTQPTEGDAVIDVKAERGILGKRDDVMGMDGFTSFWLTATELAGEAIPASYCI